MQNKEDRKKSISFSSDLDEIKMVKTNSTCKNRKPLQKRIAHPTNELNTIDDNENLDESFSNDPSTKKESSLPKRPAQSTESNKDTSYEYTDSIENSYTNIDEVQNNIGGHNSSLKSNLKHPLSSSILKTTKSILIENSNKSINNNEAGLTCSNDSMGNKKDTGKCWNMIANNTKSKFNMNKKISFKHNKKQVSQLEKEFGHGENNQKNQNYLKLLETFLSDKKHIFSNGNNNKYEIEKIDPNLPPADKADNTVNMNGTAMDESGLLSININMDDPESRTKQSPQLCSQFSSLRSLGSSLSSIDSPSSSVYVAETKTTGTEVNYNTMTNTVINEIMSQKKKSISYSNHLVEVRAVVLKVGDIDTLNEKFYAEAFIEVKWTDVSLDPSVAYNPEKHWNPQLYILNCLGELKQQIWFNQYSIEEYEKENLHRKFSCFERKYSMDLTKNEINEYHNVDKNGLIVHANQSEDAKLSSHKMSEFYSNEKHHSNGKSMGSVIVERRRINGQFWQTLDLKSFPVDVQQLTITLTTAKHANEIKLMHFKDKASSVNTKCFIDSQEWKLYKHITVNEFLRDSVFSSETFPAIDLTINAARRPTFYFWNAFFLIFLITLASLSIFSIRCHMNQSRIQTTCTLLLTSVTFKWITNRSLPTVSYMTSLDKYSLTSILLLCAQCIWHSIISSVLDMEQKCENPFSYYDHIAFFFFGSIFLIIQIVLFYWLIISAYKKRRELNKQELDYANEMIGKRSTRLKSMLYGI